MRQPLIIGNWKMNGTLLTNTILTQHIRQMANDVEGVEIVICPPYIYLPQVGEELSQSVIKVGAQNVSAFSRGAYTGEVSTEMLCEFGCSYVLLGHSERRNIYQESDVEIAEKFDATLKAGLIPVLCVGETLEQRKKNKTHVVVSAQINAVIDLVGIQGFRNAVIAYEPIWAIGTGETATPIQAQTVHVEIRQLLAKHNIEIAHNLQILYGGSVNVDNARTLFAQKDIDGGLIGGASLDAASFLQICKKIL
jgi:triosephosphate isomerase